VLTRFSGQIILCGQIASSLGCEATTLFLEVASTHANRLESRAMLRRATDHAARPGGVLVAAASSRLTRDPRELNAIVQIVCARGGRVLFGMANSAFAAAEKSGDFQAGCHQMLLDDEAVRVGHSQYTAAYFLEARVLSNMADGVPLEQSATFNAGAGLLAATLPKEPVLVVLFARTSPTTRDDRSGSTQAQVGFLQALHAATGRRSDMLHFQVCAESSGSNGGDVTSAKQLPLYDILLNMIQKAKSLKIESVVVLALSPDRLCRDGGVLQELCATPWEGAKVHFVVALQPAGSASAETIVARAVDDAPRTPDPDELTPVITTLGALVVDVRAASAKSRESPAVVPTWLGPRAHASDWLHESMATQNAFLRAFSNYEHVPHGNTPQHVEERQSRGLQRDDYIWLADAYAKAAGLQSTADVTVLPTQVGRYALLAMIDCACKRSGSCDAASCRCACPFCAKAQSATCPHQGKLCLDPACLCRCKEFACPVKAGLFSAHSRLNQLRCMPATASDSPLPQPESHLGFAPPTALPAAPPTALPAFSPATSPAAWPAAARQHLTLTPITLRKAPLIRLARDSPYHFCRSDCREGAKGEDARTLCVSRRDHLKLTLHDSDGFIFAMLNCLHKNGLKVMGPEPDAVPMQLAQGQEAVLLPGSRLLLPSSAALPAREPLVFELVRDERPTRKRAREVIDLDPEPEPPRQWPRSIGAVAPAPTSSAAQPRQFLPPPSASSAVVAPLAGGIAAFSFGAAPQAAAGGRGGRGWAGSGRGGRSRGKEVLSHAHSVTVGDETTRRSRHKSQAFEPGVTKGFVCDYVGCNNTAIRDWGGADVNQARNGLRRRFCGPEHYEAQIDPAARRVCATSGCAGFAPHGGSKGTLCLKCAAARKRQNLG